jgi:hypothetical protein
MKIVLMVAGVRGGSGFFQQLLDGHKEILTLPGHLRIDDEFKKFVSLRDSFKLSTKFIQMYPEYFDSRLNTFERHDKLGKKKNKYFLVNKKTFIDYFVKINKENKKFDKFLNLKNIHLAYSLAKGESVKKKKIILLHPHLVSWTTELIKFINLKNFVILHIIRHPLSAINSAIKNWLNYKNGSSFFAKDLYFELDLLFNGINDLTKLGKVLIIQYEHLHWKNLTTMKSFCKTFKIKYDNCLKVPTLSGLKWWGDEVSKKWLNGVNKNYQIKIDETLFFNRDLNFLQSINKKIFEKYKYQYLYPKKNIHINFFPLKSELLVFFNSIKNLNRWKQFLSIPYFYFKRIILINKFRLIERRLPKSIGDLL